MNDKQKQAFLDARAKWMAAGSRPQDTLQIFLAGMVAAQPESNVEQSQSEEAAVAKDMNFITAKPIIFDEFKAIRDVQAAVAPILDAHLKMSEAERAAAVVPTGKRTPRGKKS